MHILVGLVIFLCILSTVLYILVIKYKYRLKNAKAVADGFIKLHTVKF